jgi:hypothetical protein
MCWLSWQPAEKSFFNYVHVEEQTVCCQQVHMCSAGISVPQHRLKRNSTPACMSSYSRGLPDSKHDIRQLGVSKPAAGKILQDCVFCTCPKGLWPVTVMVGHMPFVYADLLYLPACRLEQA